MFAVPKPLTSNNTDVGASNTEAREPKRRINSLAWGFMSFRGVDRVSSSSMTS